VALMNPFIAVLTINNKTI